MSKYLNVFNTIEEYQAFSASTEYTQPNVALVKESNVLYYDYGNNMPKADMSNYKVESLEIGEGGENWNISAITKINYIPSGITSMINSFSGFTSLVTAPEIPNGVTNMYGTFQYCSSLLNAPEIPSGVTNMNYTFTNCSSLVTAPVIPDGVTDMFGTFNNCTQLVTVQNIPSGVTDMFGTFSDCIKLVNVPDIPSGVTKIRATFQECSSLTKIPNIPDTVTEMYETFRHVRNTTYRIVIPKNVTDLRGCLYNALIRDLTILIETPLSSSSINDFLFFATIVDNAIYVPDESVDAYKTATGWSEFADKFKPLSSKPTE